MIKLTEFKMYGIENNFLSSLIKFNNFPNFVTWYVIKQFARCENFSINSDFFICNTC